MRALHSLGLMSGTSLDGIDAAVLETNGESFKSFGPTYYRPYALEEQAVLAQALQEARGLHDRTARPGILSAAEQIVTDAHCEAIAALLRKSGPAVNIIGFHGQTVIHRPQERMTVQIGLAQKIADRFKIPVVADFRAADIAAGGQGAPLVPVMHLALAKASGLTLPVAIVNIGGVANVTIIEADETLLAFDTGPGNALINDWLQRKTGAIMDEDGKAAFQGKIHHNILSRLLEDFYFTMEPPKSLDRDHFDYALGLIEGLSLEDGAATLSAFTAEGISRGLRFAEGNPHKVVIAGGGARNPALLSALQQRTNSEIVTAAQMNWSGDFLEAQAFAFLAVRSLRGLPLTFPGTTGVSKPLRGGALFQPGQKPKARNQKTK